MTRTTVRNENGESTVKVMVLILKFYDYIFLQSSKIEQSYSVSTLFSIKCLIFLFQVLQAVDLFVQPGPASERGGFRITSCMDRL